MTEVFCLKCYDSVVDYSLLSCQHTFCYSCLSPQRQKLICLKCDLQSINAKECRVCSQYVSRQYQFSCGDIFCEDCLNQFWKSQIKEGYIKYVYQFVCPHCRKSQPLKENKVRKVLGDEMFVKIKERVMYKSMTKCPSCLTIFTLKSEKTNSCSECLVILCFDCNDPHTKDQPCHNTTIDNILLQVLDQDIRYCPHCNVPYLKDKRCDHVTCFSCKKQFCYFCMVDFKPIQIHGLSRHRSDCRNYTAPTHETKRCQVCKACDPPTQKLVEFVARKKYCMRQNYLDFKSAPTTQQEQNYYY